MTGEPKRGRGRPRQITGGVTVSVRGVDEQAFREFKAQAVLQGVHLGEALAEAMREYVARYVSNPRK